MPFILNSKNRTLTIKLDGELDLVSAHEFRETVDRAMEEMMSKNLIIDLNRVTFIDSSGLGVILGRFRKIKANSGEMVIFGPTANIRRITFQASASVQQIGIEVVIPDNSKILRILAEAWKVIEKRSVKEA